MFYLAFENSFCDHYVTEKMWRWLKKDIVPVVMGKADYSGIFLSCIKDQIQLQILTIYGLSFEANKVRGR